MPGLLQGDKNRIRRNNQNAEVEENVLESLRKASISLGDSIGCECRDGKLVMSGTLPSYYLKQLAQEYAGQVEGVRVVINKIRVDIAETTRPA